MAFMAILLGSQAQFPFCQFGNSTLMNYGVVGRLPDLVEDLPNFPARKCL